MSQVRQNIKSRLQYWAKRKVGGRASGGISLVEYKPFHLYTTKVFILSCNLEENYVIRRLLHRRCWMVRCA